MTSKVPNFPQLPTPVLMPKKMRGKRAGTENDRRKVTSIQNANHARAIRLQRNEDERNKILNGNSDSDTVTDAEDDNDEIVISTKKLGKGTEKPEKPDKMPKKTAKNAYLFEIKALKNEIEKIVKKEQPAPAPAVTQPTPQVKPKDEYIEAVKRKIMLDF